MAKIKQGEKERLENLLDRTERLAILGLIGGYFLVFVALWRVSQTLAAAITGVVLILLSLAVIRQVVIERGRDGSVRETNGPAD